MSGGPVLKEPPQAQSQAPRTHGEPTATLPPVEVALDPEQQCCTCGGCVVEDDNELVTITEMLKIGFWVWTYDVGMGRCRACGRRWRAKHLQLPPDQTGAKAHRVGPEVHATAVTTSILQTAPSTAWTCSKPCAKLSAAKAPSPPALRASSATLIFHSLRLGVLSKAGVGLRDITCGGLTNPIESREALGQPGSMFRQPPDPRDVQLAETLCDHSLKVKSGEMVVVQCSGLDGLGLAGACIEACARRGAAAFLHLVEPQIQRRFLTQASDDVFARLARFELKQMKDADCFIGIRGPANSFEISDVPRDRMQAYGRLVVQPVHMEERLKRTRWVVLRYPNPAMAQLAQQSTEGFADFYYRVCLLDWPRMAKAADALKVAMEATDKVRLTAPGTDLQFSIKNIPAVPCTGTCNIPDGEVFTAPVRTSVEGVVQFNTPTLYDGFAFDRIRLVFKKGKVVEATGSTPEQTTRLNEILDRDPGARFLGEFAIGFHPHIQEPMRDILFDEKIAGSFHMALGNSYDDAFNGNKSSIHWDLVCIQRPEAGGGTIEFDGKVIRKDGRFVAKALEALNPENLSGRSSGGALSGSKSKRRTKS